MHTNAGGRLTKKTRQYQNEARGTQNHSSRWRSKSNGIEDAGKRTKVIASPDMRSDVISLIGNTQKIQHAPTDKMFQK